MKYNHNFDIEVKDITKYRGLDIMPCRHDPVERVSIENCNAEDAEFWTVYGRDEYCHALAFKDFKTKVEAEKFADRLLINYPNFRTWGLYHPNQDISRRIESLTMALDACLNCPDMNHDSLESGSLQAYEMGWVALAKEKCR